MVAPAFHAHQTRGELHQHKEQRRHTAPLLTACEGLLIAGGIGIALSAFLAWVQYTTVAGGATVVNTFRGIDFALKGSQPFPEAFFLPLLAAMIICSALFSAGRRRSAHPVPFGGDEINKPSALALIYAVAAIALAAEIAYRHSTAMSGELALNFWDNARLGWYLALVSGFVAILGAAMSFGRKMRSMGFADYFLVRAPEPEPQALQGVHPPQYPFHPQGGP